MIVNEHISREFVLAGNATFTVEEPDGTHHTFKVCLSEANDRYPAAYFVKFLSGPDNENDFTYLGKLDDFTGQTRTTAKSAALANCRKLAVLNRVLARVWTGDHSAYETQGWRTHHEGCCGRCGRKLTVPASITSGIGPECARIMGVEQPDKLHRDMAEAARKGELVRRLDARRVPAETNDNAPANVARYM